MSTPDDERTGASLVTQAARLVRVVLRETAPETPSGLRLLSQIDELGAVTVTALARADRTAQPTTSTAVRALEQRGLVTRVPNPADARSTLVALSEAGRAELADVRRRNGAALAALAARHGVSTADLATAVDVLTRLTAPAPDPQ